MHFTVLVQMVNAGQTARLPCLVDRLEGFVLLWRRGGDIVSVGNHVTARDSRLEVEPGESGNHLVVRGAELADQGGYSCSVSAYKETVQKHQMLCLR